MKHRGMVTFELAIGLLSAAFVVTVLGWGVSLLTVQARCADVAGQIARELGRSDQAAADKISEQAPKGASVNVDPGADSITVTVSVDEWLGKFGPVTVTGSATAPNQGR